MSEFDVTVRPEESRHRLFGSVCLCGKWRAGCGNDIPTQWADHLRTSTTPDPNPPTEPEQGGSDDEETSAA